MAAIINIVFLIVGVLLTVFFWLLIINAILSWLVAFNVINVRNPTARQIVMGLDAATRPLLKPLRKVIPPLGGLDLSPLLVMVLIQGLQLYALPDLHRWLLGLVGAPLVY